MPQTLADGAVLLDAFPFDSNPELVTDINGYLRGDRSVDAWTMRSAFKQFFSNGVFGTPGDSFALSKAPSGLAVLVQPGCCVIEGALGGVEERVGPISLTLTPGPVAGNVIYGVFLRYDDNADVRGIELVARPGTAGASPTVPEPDTTSANVYELRLGYVMLPNGATDMSNATITNERGTSVCPFAAPFEDLDMDAVVIDAKAKAEESLTVFSEQLQTYYDLVQSAVDGTTAGNLQNQIDELKGAGLSEESVDGVTIAYEPTTTSGGVDKLQVKTGGIGTEQLADGSVTVEKLDGVVETLPSGASNGYILSSNGTSAQWSLLNNLLSGNITELWSGSGASSLTVPGIQNYSMLYFKVRFSGNLDGCAFGLLIPGTNTAVGSGSIRTQSTSNPDGVVISMDVSENQASAIHVRVRNSDHPNYLVGIYGVM